MTSVRFTEFLLLLLLHQVCSEEPELVFKSEGSVIEMGYCFGVDYIAVYRSAPEGDQLLGNSSNKFTPNTPPADLQGRVHINEDLHLLGLKISHLTHLDSGIYRRECWQNQTLITQHTQLLSVCNEEVDSEEIIGKEDGRAELLCNSSSIGLAGTSVRWYLEMYPFYKPTLFLDSNVSLEPLVENLAVKVEHSGTLLVLDSSLLNLNQQFYCLVIKGTHCLSFQNMYPPDHSERRDIFASQGDRLVLNCSAGGNDQEWETPLGKINGSSMRDSQMYISVGDESDFSLVISSISEEHRGHYSCISPSLEMLYFLFLCPKKESQERVVYEGGKISLECSVGKDGSQRVEWHRRDLSGQYEVIHDSNDEPIPIPEALRGRLTLSEDGYSLTISDLEMSDRGEYWCIVLKNVFMEEDDDYEEEYDGERTEEDAFSEDQYWPDTQKCIFKKETTLTVLVKPGRGTDSNFRAFTPEIYTTAEPPAGNSITAYAVGGGLVGLLVVGAMVAVIAVKKRARVSATRRGADSRSGVQANIQLDENACYTERLTLNNEVA
ncbi:uncharacterized protein [Brachyistius frenatus]|uniref:uncharacterized protein isoform X1 n=1 Tax=Brachyistius frenatus TaxID=100188 RepID=UPI0037E7CC03